MTTAVFYSTQEGLQITKDKIYKLKSDHKEALEDLKNSQSNNTDLSENNEYIEAKERLDKIEIEKTRLEEKLVQTRVVDPNEYKNMDKVAFGLTVKLYDVDQEREISYKIVGEEESNIKQGKISYLSPLAKAIIGSRIGDEVNFDLPNGQDRVVEVLEISK